MAYPAIQSNAFKDSSEEAFDLDKFKIELKGQLPAEKAAAVDEAYSKIHEDKPLETQIDGLVMSPLFSQ